MRVIAIAAAKNEADIIEAFVRHTLSVAQHLVVLDNGSCDGTLDILRALRNEGLALDIVEDPSIGQRQAERKTVLLREHAVRRHAADWILPLDVDEFIVPNSDSLVTPATPTSAPIALPWRTYVPFATDFSSELNPVVRIKNRLRQENWPWFKVLVPGKLAALPDAHVMPGNHEFRIGEKICQAVPATRALLAHFPIRSVGQYLTKLVIGHLQYRVIPDRPGDWGWHYRGAFEQLKNDPTPIVTGLTAAAYRYACPDHASVCTDTVMDPLEYRGQKMQYTRNSAEHWRPLQVIAAYAEDLANRFAALKAAANAQGIFSEGKFAETLAELHRMLNRQDDMLREGGAASKLRDEQFTHMSAGIEAREAELNNLRQDLAIGEGELHRLNGEIQGLGEALDHANQQNQALIAAYRSARESWTWRTGRLLVSPAEWIRKKVRTARFSKRRQAARKSSEAS